MGKTTRKLSDTPGGPFKDDEQYCHLKRALVAFCRANGSTQPDDDASEAIARLYEKAAEGVSIESLNAYAIGTARNILRENRRRTTQETYDSAEVLDNSAPEWLVQCLEHCQRKCLSSQERRLIKAYYEGESGLQIANRIRLAQKLDITTDLLKIWAYRIRKKLEPCVTACSPPDAFTETKRRNWHLIKREDNH
jgi:DNA-directed RNA polymerase specialized sigma24 family protein